MGKLIVLNMLVYVSFILFTYFSGCMFDGAKSLSDGQWLVFFIYITGIIPVNTICFVCCLGVYLQELRG